MNSEYNTQQVQKDETLSNKQTLPSRSEVQRNRKNGKKKKRKLKFPLMNFLVFIFILMLIGIFIFATYIDKESFSFFSSSDTPNHEQAVEVKKNEKISEPITSNTTTESTKEIEEVPSEPAVEVEKEVVIAEKPIEVKEREEPVAVVEQADTKELEQKSTETTSTTNSGDDEYRIVSHTVQAKETVYRISMNYYQSIEGIELIRKWNNLTGDDIQVGQVLKIPLKK